MHGQKFRRGVKLAPRVKRKKRGNGGGRQSGRPKEVGGRRAIGEGSRALRAKKKKKNRYGGNNKKRIIIKRPSRPGQSSWSAVSEKGGPKYASPMRARIFDVVRLSGKGVSLAAPKAKRREDVLAGPMHYNVKYELTRRIQNYILAGPSSGTKYNQYV